MKVKSLSHVRLLATLWTAAYQAPPSMGFSRQEYWSPGCHCCPTLGNLNFIARMPIFYHLFNMAKRFLRITGWILSHNKSTSKVDFLIVSTSLSSFELLYYLSTFIVSVPFFHFNFSFFSPYNFLVLFHKGHIILNFIENFIQFFLFFLLAYMINHFL